MLSRSCLTWDTQSVIFMSIWILGKGLNIWDTFTHEGGHVVNNDTGDVACDSFNKFREDVQLLKNMGVCLSISLYNDALFYFIIVIANTADTVAEI